MTRSVLVVGGGISGLLAARRHALAGDAVTLVEPEPVVGGAVAATTFMATHGAGGDRAAAEAEADGSAALTDLEINAGAEAFSVTSGAVEELLDQLGLADAVVSPAAGRGSRLVSDAGSLPSPRGGLLGIPGRTLSREVRTVLGPVGALRAAADRLLPASIGLRPGVTIGQYVRTRMGRRVVERLVAPVVGGVHSADPETLELTAIQPRLPAAVREHGSLAAAVRALRPGAGSATGNGAATGRAATTTGRGASATSGAMTPGTAVRSIRPTMAELPRALERTLGEHGARIRTGVGVVSVTRTAPGGGDGDGFPGAAGIPAAADGRAAWSVRLDDDSSLHADVLVLACPPDVSAHLLREPEPELAAAIPEAPSSPVRLVALALDAPALDDAPSGTGALVAPGTEAVRAKALTHASAKWDHVREAARGCGEHLHVVRLSYGRPGEELPADDTAREQTGGRSALMDRALADASFILSTPLTREHLRGARAITWDRAMRQAKPGHREALDRLSALLKPRMDLELVGSWRDGTGLDAIAAAERRRLASDLPSDTAAPELPSPPSTPPQSAPPQSASPETSQSTPTEGSAA
ncbi:protoporphyrinogen/coproporphyrinogen oxidase [Brachybacterium nesterenkovii]|uniref:protoporphyrinogen/coproporphyrinogen oxidase n=1 Tax=Brachybacterium nesterenkovii TaxID=47847 RepID=UPI00321AF14A